MILFASDFDGTLYFMKGDPSLRREDEEAIREFQKDGNLFGICTGRSLKGILPVVNGKISFDFFILASGALILDGEQNILFQKTLPLSLVREVYERYEGKVPAVIQGEDTVFSFLDGFPMQKRITSFEELIDAPLYGLSFGTASEEAAGSIAEEINRLYGESLHAFVNVKNVDIAPRGCSKGTAIQWIRNHFQPEKVCAAGDSFNDLPMLAAADEAFLIATGSKGLAEALPKSHRSMHVSDALLLVRNGSPVVE